MSKFTSVLLGITFLGICSAQAKLVPYEDPATKLFGLKDDKGKVIVEPQFTMVGKSAEGETLIPVIKNGTFLRLDQNGQVKFEAVFFDNLWDYYEEGLSRFLKDHVKVGFHDSQGNVVIKPEYDFATPFKEGFSKVCNGCYAYYPKSPKFQPLSSSGLLGVTIQEEFMDIAGGKWGVINKRGEIVVPLKYDTLQAAEAQLPKKQGK